MKAEEALDRYKKTGQELTVKEVLEMGKEEVSKLVVMVIEKDPKLRAEFITLWAEYYYALYEWEASVAKIGLGGILPKAGGSV